jgi:hypothetical protein
VLPRQIQPHGVAIIQIYPNIITLAAVAGCECEVERGACCGHLDSVGLVPNTVLPIARVLFD